MSQTTKEKCRGIWGRYAGSGANKQDLILVNRTDKLEQSRNNLIKGSASICLLLHMILADVKLTGTTSSDDQQGTLKIPTLDEDVTSTSQC